MNNILTLLFTLLLLLGVVWNAGKSLLQALKQRKRFASLRMNPQEIPLYPEQPPDQLAHPVVLTRKTSRKGIWFLYGFGSGIVAIISVIILVIPFTIVALLWPMSFSLSKSFSLGALVFMGMILFWIVMSMIINLFLYQRVEANEAGLTVQRGLLRKYLPWDQAHLFAVDQKREDKNKEKVSNWDELSGGRVIVRWEHDVETSPRSLLKFTPPEYQQELARLRSYIRKKTDLPLRDLRPFRV